MFRQFVKLAAVTSIAALAGFVPADAAPLATLSATYDGFLDNAVFTITNNTLATEGVALLTSLAPNATVTLPSLAAGMVEQYSFNRISGGFETDPFNAGTPDTTTYQFSITQGGSTATSAAFSPITNLTGGYVDFLGNTCQGFASGCPVALSGVVASVSATAVPEPYTVAILLVGLTGIAVSRRRPFSNDL